MCSCFDLECLALFLLRIWMHICVYSLRPVMCTLTKRSTQPFSLAHIFQCAFCLCAAHMTSIFHLSDQRISSLFGLNFDRASILWAKTGRTDSRWSSERRWRESKGTKEEKNTRYEPNATRYTRAVECDDQWSSTYNAFEWIDNDKSNVEPNNPCLWNDEVTVQHWTPHFRFFFSPFGRWFLLLFL